MTKTIYIILFYDKISQMVSFRNKNKQNLNIFAHLCKLISRIQSGMPQNTIYLHLKYV